MSINLHISADSAKDFFQHLSELSAGFYVSAGAIGAATVTTQEFTASGEFTKPEAAKEISPETIGAGGGAASPEPKAARKPRAAKSEPASSGSGDQSSESIAAEPEVQSETTDGSSTVSPTSSSETTNVDDEGREGPYPDFDTEVTPVVLGAVRAKGKEWVAALLGEFGVEKASQLKDAQFQELIDTINERMQ